MACGQKGPKGALVRIVRTPDGLVVPDPTGRANGRGAYLCSRVSCWESGLAKRALARSLRIQVSDADLEALQNYYIEIIQSGGANLGTGRVARESTGAPG
ncbi:MAG: YlxR family protein [Chloroflexi bacterium]|nr:YlxR family protein [Chloroflexota bacterium]